MNVRELFSSISDTYDLLNRLLSGGIDQRWRKRGVALIPQGKEIKVLDIASGTLDLTIQYLKRGMGEVYCVDFSCPMLLKGKTKLTPPMEKNIHIVCGDGLNLPFVSHYFDAAMCAFGIRNFLDLEKNLEEVSRALKPKGLLLILEFFKPTKVWTQLFSHTYERYILPTLGGFLSRNKKAYRYLYNSIQNFYTQQEYIDLLDSKGFQILKTKELSGGIASLILAYKNGTSS